MKSVYKKILRIILPSKIKKLILSLIPDETPLVYQLIKDVPTHSRIMFDVGAGHGTTFTSFAKDGWRVYAFEPDSENRRICEHLNAKLLDKVLIDARAVSNKLEANAKFYRSDISSGISGLSRFHPSHKDAGTVETVTLDVFCQDHQIEKIGYLKVDAEGYDLFVLEGLTLDKIKPEIIMCEFEDIKTVPLGYSFHDFAKYLIKYGYYVFVSEWYPAVNRGGPHRWNRFTSYPCELINQNAWGNIIAVLNQDHISHLQRLCTVWSTRWKFGNIVARFC